MKRPPSYYLLSLACFFSCYGAGLYLPRWIGTGEEAATTTQAQTATPPTGRGHAPGSASEPHALPRALAEDKGPELFDTLYGNRAWDPFPAVRDALADRFGSAYPATGQEALVEMASRMGILKAMDNAYRGAPAADTPAIGAFYVSVAQNNDEPPCVRRQAYHNLTAWAGRLGEDERLALLARIPDRALATAGKSEAEILEEVFRHGK